MNTKTYTYKTHNVNIICDLAEMAEDMNVHFSVVMNWHNDDPDSITFHNVNAEQIKMVTDFISAERG